MTPTSADNLTPLRARRDAWLDRVRTLVDQVEEWAKAEHWVPERHQERIQEQFLGEYEAPALRITVPIEGVPDGQLLLTPIALQVGGEQGRVDLRAIPTMSRVRLLAGPDGWRMIAGSNIPLRLPWARETFVQLAQDLLS